MWQSAAPEPVVQDTANSDCIGGHERGIVNGENDTERLATTDVYKGDYNRNR